MDSFDLDGKFKSYDAVRRKDSADEYRLSEFKNKLMYSAERKLQPYLSRMTGAKVLSTRIDKLEISQDNESGAPIFTGKIVAEVSFVDGKQMKIAAIPVSILSSQPEILSKDFEDALASAKEPEVAPTASTATSVTASLRDFKIVHDGTKYLKVYHTAAYGDLEPIGAVSEEEYANADKKTLLQEMFKDEAVSWPADVTFIDEFAEPEIVEALPAPDTQYVVKAPTAAEPALAKEADVDITWRYKVTDNARLTAEAEQKNFDALQTRLTQRALSTFTDAWNARHLGNMKIKNTDTKFDSASGTGTVTVQAEVLDGKDTKLVPFTIDISGNTMRLPDLANISSLLKEAKIVEAAPAPVVTKKASLAKKATPMAPTKQNYQEVLRMPKDFLPASLKVGDIIEVDGLRYRLSSKSEGQLSKERDTASHWLFERVHGEGKPIYRQDAY